MVKIAEIKLLRGEFSAAKKIARAAVNRFEELKPTVVTQYFLSLALNQLASVYIAIARYGDAERILRRAAATHPTAASPLKIEIQVT